MNYLITSDTHLGHSHKILNRPIGFENKILKKHIHAVNENDVLIHLGDFCIGKDAYWHELFMNKVKGKKWLIKGNHDKKSNTWYLSHGWDFVGNSIFLEVFGKTILFTHKPEPAWNHEMNIHGHLHNDNHKDHEFPFLASSSTHVRIFLEDNYTPFNLLNLVQKFDRKIENISKSINESLKQIKALEKEIII